MSVVPFPAPEENAFAARVARRKAELAEAAHHAGLKGDPYQHVIETFAEVLDIFPLLVRELREVSYALTPEDRALLIEAVQTGVDQGAGYGVYRAAQILSRATEKRATTRVGIAGVVGLFAGLVLGVGVCWLTDSGRFSATEAWASLIKMNPDPRPALASGIVENVPGGGQAVTIRLWLHQPPPPPPSR